MDEHEKKYQERLRRVAHLGAARILQQDPSRVVVFEKFKKDPTEWVEFTIKVGGIVHSTHTIHNGNPKYLTNLCIGLFLERLVWAQIEPPKPDLVRDSLPTLPDPDLPGQAQTSG